jgi:hypothetical protein
LTKQIGRQEKKKVINGPLACALQSLLFKNRCILTSIVVVVVVATLVVVVTIMTFGNKI